MSNKSLQHVKAILKILMTRHARSKWHYVVLYLLQADYRDDGVNNVENLLKNNGGRLVDRCLQAAVFHVSGSLKRDMAELMYNVRKLSKEVG